MYIFHEAIRCYKRDPQEYRRRVTESDWKDVHLVGEDADSDEFSG